MINESMSLTFEDGTVGSILLPAFTVAVAVIDETPDRIAIIAAQKMPSEETGTVAYMRAYTEFKQYKEKWSPTSGMKCGRISTGSPFPYWHAVLVKKSGSILQLEVDHDDPILAAYGHIFDREAAHGKGKSKLEMDAFIDSLTRPIEKKSSASAPAPKR
jgi:hypothetical protein